ncbi:MAG: helix-turn-helix transcriptional regulator [Ktedonobacteraceae bacterium]
MNEKLIKARNDRHWSIARAAEKIGVSRTTYLRWEHSNQFPHGSTILLACDAFNMSAEQLGFVSSNKSECFVKISEQLEELVKEGINEQGTEDGIDMNRREATKTIGKILGAAALADVLGDIQPLEQLSKLIKPVHIDAQTLEHFEKLTEICWKLGNGHDLETAESILKSYLPKVAALAKQASPYQQIAAYIASQGFLLSASLAGHRDDLNARQSLSEQAFQFGQLAENGNLQVAALKQLAITYDYKQRPGKALDVYQKAVPYLDKASPLLRAGISIRMAGTYAQCGQSKEALHFLSIAYDSFPDDPENDPSYLYADSGLYSLILWDGLIHLDLDQPKKAEKAFARVDGLSPKIEVPERVRVEFLTYQAETYLVLRELEQCCTYLEAAADASLELGSERRYNEAANAYQQIRHVWIHEPRVKALRDLFVKQCPGEVSLSER